MEHTVVNGLAQGHFKGPTDRKNDGSYTFYN